MTKPFSGFFKSSSIQSSNERIGASRFSVAMFEHKTTVQIWVGLTCAKCLCASKTSLTAEATGGEIVVEFLLKHMTSEAIPECLILKIFLGNHAPRSP